MSFVSSRRTSMAKLSSTPSRRPFMAIARGSSPALVDTDDDNEQEISTTPKSNYGSFIEDQSVLKAITRHLPGGDPDTALKLPSGDITRDLYHLADNSSKTDLNNSSINSAATLKTPSARLTRSKSLSETDSFNMGERRPSVVNAMRLPGGFRRDFIQTQKRKRFGWELEPVTPFTKNFIEFLSIYGHFAGENLEDEDFLACDYDDQTIKTDEEQPLVCEDDEQRERERGGSKEVKKTSSVKAFFLLLKAFIGTGILFLPKAVSNGGLVFSIVLLLFFSVLSYYCYLVLSQCTILTNISSFVDLGEKMYGRAMKYLILISIVVTQLGFVAAYTIFTAENLKAFLYNSLGLKVELWMMVLFESVFFLPMSLIRNLTKLSLAALLANIFILGGILTIVIYSTKDLIKDGVQKIEYFNGNSWSLFIGVAIFAFEGIGLIIPVQQSMKNPKEFPIVLMFVIMVCAVLFIGVGSLGYITYGENVQTVVILNLPQNAIPVICIQFFYALAIMLSVPLQLLPAIRIMEARIFSKGESGRFSTKTKWIKNLFRSLITIFTCILAWKGSENLDLFVSFVGCFACVPLVYMYPPLLHSKIIGLKENSIKGNEKYTKFIQYLDWSIVLFGGVAAVYTTYQLFV